MKKVNKILTVALAAAAVCSAAYAAAATEDSASGVESVESGNTSETSVDSNSGLTSNYLTLHMSGGKAKVDFRENGQLGEYPEVHDQTRFSIDVGCSGTITIDRPGYNIIAVKIGSSDAKRDMTKVSDTVYDFTVQEGDIDIDVIFEGDNSEAESSAPAPSEPVSSEPASTAPTRPKPEPYEPDNYEEPTTHESAPEADTNPDTGIALAAAPAALAAAVVIVAAKKRR